MKIIEHPSPNFNDRRNGANPDFIIFHYTDMHSAPAALRRLCDPQAEVSAHYLIDEEGAIYKLVDETKRAWHAGKSWWAGEEDLNSRSIGIELAHPGHSFGYGPFPAAQMAALTSLCRNILKRHAIPARHVLAHSDIAPARKRDPGELFDWKGLADAGIGLWPAPRPEDSGRAAALLSDEGALRAALTSYGYAPDIDLKTVLTAFQRHFHPEVFKTPERIGVPDRETAARLSALL
jgi:N-acetylmuramoyl-L-alanine amidase